MIAAISAIVGRLGSLHDPNLELLTMYWLAAVSCALSYLRTLELLASRWIVHPIATLTAPAG
jgi:hypothetical protein